MLIMIMNNDYRILAQNVENRLNPERLILEKSFSDELRTLSYSDVLVYVRLAMKGVDPVYTRRSIEAGERVKTHLEANMTNVVFRYQGSVMTNTHIRSYSDVDILTISSDFYRYDRNRTDEIINDYNQRSRYYDFQVERIQSQINAPDYNKDALTELRRMRMNAEDKLAGVYSICDCTKPKSIKITNTNLKRDVDIVIANWYDDVLSIINNKGEYRGIQVYNKETHSMGDADFPFLSIDRINNRGNETVGRLKKMIRFLKNLKAKSDHDIELSSFDINAICYDIDVNLYQGLTFYQLVPVLYRQLKNIANDQSYSDRVTSVDGREYIFRYNQAKLDNLRLILAEVEGVYIDLRQQQSVN